MALMTAAVVYEPGGPEALEVETRMIPTPEPGEVLIRIEASGLDGSGLLARRGQSVGVTFPQILGAEAVGLVEEAPGKHLRLNAKLISADDERALVGSTDIDRSASDLRRKLSCFVGDRAAVEALHSCFNNDWHEASDYTAGDPLSVYLTSEDGHPDDAELTQE